MKSVRSLKEPLTYLKAISAGIVAFLGAYTTAYQTDGIQGNEWVFIGGTTAIAAIGVFFTPNKDPKGIAQDQSVQPPNRAPGFGEFE